MKYVIKTALGLVAIGGLLLLLMSAAQTRPQGKPSLGFGDRPIIKKLSTYRGNHFPGFAEFRVQQIEYGDLGDLLLVGEPYDLLLNVTYITSAYRYEDKKNTDYSTLMFTNYQEGPILVRQPYKDVVSSIRKGMEANIK